MVKNLSALSAVMKPVGNIIRIQRYGSAGNATLRLD
jgi:hypothetical protein